MPVNDADLINCQSVRDLPLGVLVGEMQDARQTD